MGIIDRQKIMMEKWAANISRWIGSTASVTVHTIVFLTSFLMPVFGIVSFDRMLLVLTTIVSLEAIYLSIFIQMSINMHNQKIDIIQEDIVEIGEDIEEIGEDIVEIQKDVDEIQEDVDSIQEEVDEIQEDVEGIQEDVEEIQEDVEEIQEDVDEIYDEAKEEETTHPKTSAEILASIQTALVNLQREIEQLQGLK